MVYADRVKRRLFLNTSGGSSGCTLWSGTLNSSGYGRTWYLGRQITTHRLSWILCRGQIPSVLWVLHTCDTRHCINPDHLFLGDRSANLKDAYRKGRFPRGTRRGISRKLTDKQIE